MTLAWSFPLQDTVYWEIRHISVISKVFVFGVISGDFRLERVCWSRLACAAGVLLCFIFFLSSASWRAITGDPPWLQHCAASQNTQSSSSIHSKTCCLVSRTLAFFSSSSSVFVCLPVCPHQTHSIQPYQTYPSIEGSIHPVISELYLHPSISDQSIHLRTIYSSIHPSLFPPQNHPSVHLQQIHPSVHPHQTYPFASDPFYPFIYPSTWNLSVRSCIHLLNFFLL